MHLQLLFSLSGMLNNQARNTLILFRWVSVYHKVKFSDSNTHQPNIVDAIIVRPEQTSSNQRNILQWFDTVLVRGKQDSIHGVNSKHHSH
jgi:hypothetical protein